MGNVFVNKTISVRLLTKHYAGMFFLVSGAAGLLLFFNQSHINFRNACIAFLLTFLYSVPLLPLNKLAFLRKAGFVKTILLAFTWAYVTAYLPLAHVFLHNTTEGCLFISNRFLFMLVLCIIFDNRDIAVDKIRGLHSLSTDVKPFLMQLIVLTCFVLLVVINLLFYKYQGGLFQMMALQLSTVITLLVYFFSWKKRSYFFYYFIVDGMVFLSALLTTVASI